MLRNLRFEANLTLAIILMIMMMMVGCGGVIRRHHGAASGHGRVANLRHLLPQAQDAQFWETASILYYSKHELSDQG